MMQNRRATIGLKMLSITSILGGVYCLFTGRAGYRAAYATGTHVRLAGALLLCYGLWLARKLYREDQ